MKETDIQNAICEYLRMRQYFFWRQNQVPPTFMKNGQRQFRRMSKWSMNGVPDIIVIVSGRFIGIEVKAPNGKQSESQKLFEDDCIKAGGMYIVARSVDEVALLL